MSFKDLVLDRELIDESLNTFSELLTISCTNKNEARIDYEAYFNGKPKALVIFHLKANGKTTIQVTSGANTDLSEALAVHVVENCQIAVASKGSFTIKPLNADSFTLLLEYLQTECFASVSEPVDIVGGNQYEICGRQGDRVKASYYDNNTFLIQGCPLMLHSQVVDFLGEILDLHELVDAQLKLVATGITSQEILLELDALLPNSHNSIENRLKAVISPALALKKLEIDLSDYSVMAFPALKGLEGYIKQLYASKGITVGRKGFAPHLRDDSHNTISEITRAQINCAKTSTAINRCYEYYKNQRNGIFHADGLIRNTRLIEDRNTAESIVTDVLTLIESTYVEINS